MPKIICAQCKAIEDVDELPPAHTTVLCTECKTHTRRAQIKPTSPRTGPKIPKNKPQSIPRKRHNTRVMLPITCKECGQPDTLDYVPKGANLDEILCRDCAAEIFGDDSDWARIEGYKKKDAEKDKEWEFQCDDCGRTDYLPFEPQDDRQYQCNLCRFEHDTPSPDRISGRKKAAGGVFIRRPPPSETSEEPDDAADSDLTDNSVATSMKSDEPDTD